MNNNKKNNSTLILIAVGILIIVVVLLLWLFVFKGEKKENVNENEAVPVEDGKYEYEKGVLYKVKDSSEFVIKGVMLVGDEREELGYMDEYAKNGYKTKNLKSSFKLGEWINVYLDTEFSTDLDIARVYITPHKPLEEHLKLSIEDLNSNALEAGGYYFIINTPDERNFNFAGNGYVAKDSKAGAYDILFVYNGEIVYYIVIDVA